MKSKYTKEETLSDNVRMLIREINRLSFRVNTLEEKLSSIPEYNIIYKIPKIKVQEKIDKMIDLLHPFFDHDKSKVIDWLNTFHAELGDKTPIEMIINNTKYKKLVKYLKVAIKTGDFK